MGTFCRLGRSLVPVPGRRFAGLRVWPAAGLVALLRKYSTHNLVHVNKAIAPCKLCEVAASAARAFHHP